MSILSFPRSPHPTTQGKKPIYMNLKQPMKLIYDFKLKNITDVIITEVSYEQSTGNLLLKATDKQSRKYKGYFSQKKVSGVSKRPNSVILENTDQQSDPIAYDINPFDRSSKLWFNLFIQTYLQP